MITSSSVSQDSQPPSDPHAPPGIPAWVRHLAGDASEQRPRGGFEIAYATGPWASFISVRLRRANQQSAADFEKSVIDAYGLIHAHLAASVHPHPARFWNYLPSIHQPMDAARDRYMVFNAGRFRALTEWFGGSDRLLGHLPAASAVGRRGDELVIQCLALERPGVMIENPRQVPAFQYSACYGPLPPCFARATVAPHPRDGGAMLLAAGTASIRGEQSVHPDDLAQQLVETLENLRVLLAAARGPGERTAMLAAFEHVRAYYVREQDAPLIGQSLRSAFSKHAQLELVHADLCRADLLVEVEGIARLSGGAAP